MKISYYKKTDSLSIELSDTPGADSKEIADGNVNLSSLESTGMTFDHMNIVQA